MNNNKFKYSFLYPKYWGIWFGVFILRIISLLPYKTKLNLGKWLGRQIFKLAKKRKKIVLINLENAFPNKTLTEINKLALQHFESLGISFFESMLVWWGEHHSKKNCFEKSLITYKNLHNLEQALQAKQGVILISPHFSTADITGLFLSFKIDIYPVYRPHDNALMDYLILKGRTLNNIVPIAKNNTRAMIKILKTGDNLGFLPDQKYTHKGHIKVPFFNKDAPSNPATSKLVKITNCLVLPTFLTRLDNGSYELNFHQPIENFASADDFADTLRLHKIYEQEITKNPAQYLWIHNRWNIKNM
jgi:KDO2-lipid IV(A) lauroyltransferase